MIFSAKKIQEYCWEQQKPKRIIFYNHKKAFDSVPRHYVYPKEFTVLIQALNVGMMGRFQHQNSLLDPFTVTVCLKHLHVLAPTMHFIY